MKSLLLFAISFLFFSPLSSAQTVWPGDVNNNGIVNEIDLLYLSFAFGETGSPRTIISSDWAGQNIATTWTNTFPDGLNFVYADCNGDGIVNELDADVIEMNLTLIHTDVPFVADDIIDAIEGQEPKFTFFQDSLSVASGQTYQLKLGLGNEMEGKQVSDFLGLSFTIKMTPKKAFNTNASSFAFNGINWIKDPLGNNTSIEYNDEENGNITVAVISTDRMEIPGGSGEFGEISFVIIDNVVDLLVTADTVKIEIDSITVITDELEKLPLEGSTVVLDVEDRIISSTYNPILDKIQLYPNPTSGWILLRTNEVEIERVELVNALGQTIYQKKLNQNHFQSLDLQAIPKGLYWLKMISKYGVKSTPIQKL